MKQKQGEQYNLNFELMVGLHDSTVNELKQFSWPILSNAGDSWTCNQIVRLVTKKYIIYHLHSISELQGHLERIKQRP